MQVQNQVYQQVELFISCKNLKNKDFLSKSDPFVIFYLKTSHGQWQQFGKTEKIKNNVNPIFPESFKVDYIFETRQDCKFEVRDSDGNSSDLIGEVETTIGTIVGKYGSCFTQDLLSFKNQKSQGKLIVRAEPVNFSDDQLIMQWSGIKIKNVDGLFDKSDPFIRFLRINEDKSTTVVQETEVVKNNLNPLWKLFEITAQKLCNSNYNRPMKLECWDWEKNAKHQFIGEVEFKVSEIISGKRQFTITEPKKNKQTGTLVLNTFQIIQKPGFLGYIRGGVQLNQIIAIDYTGSNGIPSQPSSLHYINPQQMNQYQQAIWHVGDILQSYDSDKKIPLYGFGAKTKFPQLSSAQVLHCFPVSGNPQKVEACGLQEVMQMYQNSLTQVELSGPTFFNPILQETIKIAQQSKQAGSNIYTILLILTDGEIHDMKPVIDSIVLASELPLSIIIIGVGKENFTNMEILDGDKGLQNQQGQKAKRDIVQFVPFKKYNDNINELARSVLSELPDQLVSYYISQGIKPRPPIQVNLQNIQ